MTVSFLHPLLSSVKVILEYDFDGDKTGFAGSHWVILPKYGWNAFDILPTDKSGGFLGVRQQKPDRNLELLHLIPGKMSLPSKYYFHVLDIAY